VRERERESKRERESIPYDSVLQKDIDQSGVSTTRAGGWRWGVVGGGDGG